MKINGNGVLITGATGFIGYNFSKYMVDNGFDVHLLVRSTSNLKDLESRQHTNIHYYNGESDSIEKIFNNHLIENVFHLANHYDKSDDSTTIGKLNEVCIRLTSQLFEIIKKQNHSVGFVNIGTIWQTNNLVDNAYTMYKIFQEELVKYYSNKFKINSLSILLTDTYGPNDVRPKLLNYIKFSIRENKEINIMNPNASINLVYIDDVCSALHQSIRIMESQSSCFYRFKVQAESTILIKDLISLIKLFYSLKLNVVYEAQSPIPMMISSYEVETLPGWEPKIDLIDGLTRLFKEEDLIL